MTQMTRYYWYLHKSGDTGIHVWDQNSSPICGRPYALSLGRRVLITALLELYESRVRCSDCRLTFEKEFAKLPIEPRS